MKKVISAVLAVMMMLSVALTVNAENLTEDIKGYIYMTVERITLGQGLIQEPVKVPYKNGESLAEITERVLGDKSTFTGDMASYNLNGVKDGGEPTGWSTNDVPGDIMSAFAEEETDLEGRAKAEVLSAYDYSFYSGWMFTVDNISINAGAGAIYEGEDTSDGSCYKDGSVVRLQYSLYGWGEDLGISWGYFDFKTTNTFCDRSSLVRKIADINNDGSQEKYGEAYNEAVTLLNTWNITEAQITNVLDKIQEIDNSHQHSYSYVGNGDGTHKKTCADCDTSVNEECSFVDGTCSYCGTQKITGIYGDVDLDNEVSIKDATLVQKHIAGIVELSPRQLFNATVDNEKKINVAISTKIQKIVCHKELETMIGSTYTIYTKLK